MTHCPICKHRLIRTETFIERSVIFRCVPCNRFLVEGSDQWIDAGPGLRDTLTMLASNMKHDQAVVKEVMESSIDDPRWERMYVD